MQHNKRFEQSPDSTISFQGNPAFYVYVWPLRARLPLGTAQLKRSVMLRVRCTQIVPPLVFSGFTHYPSLTIVTP